MLKTTILTLALLCCFVMSSSVGAVPANGDFEQGLLHWTQVMVNDGSNEGTDGGVTAITNAHFDGLGAARGGANILGDYPNPGDSDWCRVFLWSDPLNLTGFAGVEFYLSNFITDGYHPAWGEGEAVIFNITDGVNTATIHVIDHVVGPPPFAPYGDSLVSRGDYTPNVLGNDGNLWSKFVVTAATPGFNLGSVNLANAKIGFEWEVINNYPHPTDWYQSCSIIDGVSLRVPEPGSLLLLASGLCGLLMRRRRA